MKKAYELRKSQVKNNRKCANTPGNSVIANTQRFGKPVLTNKKTKL